MHIELNLSNILELIAVFVSLLCGKIDLGSDKVCKIISKLLSIFSICYLVLGCLTLENHLIMAVLRFSQRNWKSICLYVLFFALLPPFIASWERKTKNAPIEPSYVKWNGFYNLLGAVSACSMLRLAHDIVGDFSYLKEFQMEGIVSILISVCVWLVFTYQNIERHKDLPDHDADTKWLNQKLNMLHLFHTFFLSAISVVFIVCYSIYCYIHNLQLTLHPNYLFFLTLALLFFYSLSQHFHLHVHMVFVVMVPVILVSSMYWMSWFSMNNKMRFGQWIFTVLHSLSYALFIFIKNKMIFIGNREDMEEDRYTKLYKLGNWVCAIEHGGFQGILLLIVIICYSISWLVPILTQRIEGCVAENFIVKVCEDTDIKADEMITLAKKRSAYDTENQDYDSGKYLKFVYEELYLQILDKGIINEDSTFLTYEELQYWYTTVP